MTGTDGFLRSAEARRLLRTSTQRRLIELGVNALSEVELVATLLRVGPGTCAHEKAAALLASFGSVRRLLLASRTETAASGLNGESHAALQAALELARRHYQQLMMSGPALSNPRATREYLRMRLRDLPHEVFGVVYLDNRNRVIRFSELFRGTIDGASVHPREVVKEALSCNAASAILVHNHPFGVAEPSQADELITRRLKEALGLVDIRVLDHLIVGDGVVESFVVRGLL